MFSTLTKQLIATLSMLPGIGPKSAQRLAFHLLAQPQRAKGFALSHILQQAMTQVGTCTQCHMYTENATCDLCVNPKRDRSLLCVVENPADAAAIEQTQAYSGLYFVLQGHLSPLDGLGPDEIGIPALLARLADAEIKELIIATNPTVEGKATAHYIAHHIDTTHILCSRIAHGVPLGGELEYLDSGTLSHAFYSRAPINNY